MTADRNKQTGTITQEHPPTATPLVPETPPTLDGTEPQAVTVLPDVVDVSKTSLSGAQQLKVDEVRDQVFAKIREYLSINRELAKTHDAFIVHGLGRILATKAGVDGAKGARQLATHFFDEFINPDHSIHIAVPAMSLVQTFKGKEVVAAMVRTNPRYRQWFTDWIDMARWEVKLFKPPTQTGQASYPGEVEPGSEKDVSSAGVRYTREGIGPDGKACIGITINGVCYEKPSLALGDGIPRYSVYQAWRNVVRPKVEEIEVYPSVKGKKSLYDAAHDFAREVSMTVRERRTMERKGKAETRLQKVSKRAEELPEAALLGLINGLLSIASTRKMPLTVVTQKIEELSQAPDDRTQVEAAEEVQES